MATFNLLITAFILSENSIGILPHGKSYQGLSTRGRFTSRCMNLSLSSQISITHFQNTIDGESHECSDMRSDLCDRTPRELLLFLWMHHDCSSSPMSATRVQLDPRRLVVVAYPKL
ncbi:hypothetical protein HETIRDRAFT_422201 [Heterobasidion irregulare TC 32-1]|uniref:Uncharacterized protein n=1 Tax=Heterobasidion irregulare (strain TC 32-1) TaxID=747525 RepID=W4JTQ6_HETIT|nr:uncharacterized protein HETIRDRAFT_422201 [Heterobasidion irregulare TC 32-1]ETW76824.1 hypothetical protein HETIRDRAFT_422201 [Heterobasidion irregulare TC 32-1]